MVACLPFARCFLLIASFLAVGRLWFLVFRPFSPRVSFPWHKPPTTHAHAALHYAGLEGYVNELILSKTLEAFSSLEGAPGEFQIWLNSQPTSSVTVQLSSPDSSTVFATSTIQFNQSNWAQPQQVYLTPKRDYLLLDSPYNTIVDVL